MFLVVLWVIVGALFILTTALPQEPWDRVKPMQNQPTYSDVYGGYR